MLIKDFLKNHRLVTDGAMGTYYSQLHNWKQEQQETLISEYANQEEPDLIKQIHKQYLQAGARLLRTNTFALHCRTLGITTEIQHKLIHKACCLAKEAVREYKEEISDKQENCIFIAGDIGPIFQAAEIQDSEIEEEYCRIADAFLEEGVDTILFETFSDTEKVLKTAEYIKKQYPDQFIIAQFCMNKNGYTAHGISAESILRTLSQSNWVDAIGFNCGIGSGHMLKLLSTSSLPNNKILIASPNAGYPEQLQNRMVFLRNAAYFAENIRQIAELGVTILGACCGTTPVYISEMTKKIKGMPLIQEKIEENKREYAINGNADFLYGQSVSRKELLGNLWKKNELYHHFQTGKKIVAVELDPPFDASDSKIIEHAHSLKTHSEVNLITIADSPMGRSRVDSVLMGIKISKVTGITVMPHLCCRDRNLISMRSVLLGAHINDIRNLLIVTGDPVPAESRQRVTGVFDYNSIRLMEYVSGMNEEFFGEEPFYFGGALNPGLTQTDQVIARTKKKMEAGAGFFLTQPVFSKADQIRLRNIKEETGARILCGIMPFVSYKNANFIKNEFAGIFVPDEMVNRYRPDMTKEEAEQTGAGIANEMIESVSGFVDGYYIMLPFNRVSIMNRLIF